MKHLLLAVSICGAAMGCSSLFHFKDPTTQAVTCGVASAEIPIIESAAAICGPFAPACLDALVAIYGSACADAAAHGKSQEEAHQAGLEAVNRRASAMKAELVKAGVSK